MAFCIDKNQLKIQNFPESWRDKLNNMNSILVEKEVLEEIKKNDEFTESIESNYNKWNIKNNSDKILLSYNSINNVKIDIQIDILYAEIKAIKLLKNKDLLMKVGYIPKFEFDLIELMIEDYVNSRFKLSLYGTELMEHLLKKNKFEFIDKILKNIIKLTIKNENKNFISNLLLMWIVTDNFYTLSQYPEIINWFLSRIAFFVPDDTLNE
ncbi:33826_t:CDS:2, partial [Racocetra persica]